MTVDLRDVILEAVSEVQEIIREETQELVAPVMQDKFVEIWVNLPDEMKEKFKVEQPEAYRALMESMKK